MASHHTEEQPPVAQAEEARTQPLGPKAEHDTLSITEILRAHCREKLVIDPLNWTARHLQLLGCGFGPLRRADNPLFRHTRGLPGEDDPDLVYSSAATAKRIATTRKMDSRVRNVRRFLTDQYCPFRAMSQSLQFHFGNQFMDLPCQLFSLKDEFRIMYMASIDREDIQTRRRQELELLKPDRSSAPVEAIIDLKMKKVTPPNRLYDPYIVALLLAIAREQRKYWGQRRYSKNLWAQVLMTDRGDEHVHLYAAFVEDSFLDKLDSPSVKPTEQKVLLVRHMAMELMSYHNLHLRLFPILLHPEDYYRLGEELVPFRCSIDNT